MYRRMLFAALALFLGLASPVSQPLFAAQSQESPAPPPQTPPQRRTDQDSPSAVAATEEHKKVKKVWTNDELGGGSATAPVKGAKNSAAAKKATIKPATPQEAAAFRKQLAALQAQLANVEKQIADLKSFSKGEKPGANGLQMHKAYTMEPIENQVQKLEDKRKSITAQIDAVFDAARKRGIEPGQLR